MAKKNIKPTNMGKTKKSTDDIIADAVARQTSWMENRRAFAKRFLRSLNIFARPATKKIVAAVAVEPKVSKRASKEKRSGWTAYWFPILCVLLVIFIAAWVAFVRVGTTPQQKVVVIPVVAVGSVATDVPEPVVTVVEDELTPSFDIVRIERDGNIVVAGRWLPNQNVSVALDGKIVATERTNSRGEFVYAPTRHFNPGNYTISLIGTNPTIESIDKVFIYVSPNGYENSVSLLITKNGSTLLQAPKLVDGDLSISKIDYLENGRIVVTGDALPRLRVSLTLNDKYLGFARVSDHKHFGLGADVEKLIPGTEYTLTVRLHDGDGRTIANVTHTFVMPEMTGDDDTFYTVRRGDCLWIIARNFMRRGTLFSIIAERNNIKNPNLIFPKQVLQIPVSGK